MHLPTSIEVAVDTSSDPESVLLVREQSAEQARWMRVLRRAKDPVKAAKKLGITYADFAELASNKLALRAQVIVRCELEAVEDEGDELRCRVNRKPSRVTITKGATK